MQQEQGQNAIMAAVQAMQDQVKADLQKAAVSLEQLRKKVDEAAEADNRLAELKLQVDAVAKAVSDAMGALENRYNLVSKRLDEIGAPPAAGQPAEDAGLSSDRKRLQGEKAQMNGILSDADALDKQAVDLAGHITDLRRKLFTETLFRHTEINEQFLQETVAAGQSESAQLWARAASAFDFMWKFKRQSLFIALGLIFAVAVAESLLVRWMFGRMIYRNPNEQAPSYTHRLAVAFWSTMIPSLGGAVFVMACLLILAGFNVLRQDIGDIVRAALWVIVGVYFIWKLARAIVSPDKPQWRLLDVSDGGARRVVGFAIALAVLNGLSYIINQTNIALDAPVVLTAAEGFVSALLIGFVLVLLAFVHPMKIAPNRSAGLHKLLSALLIISGIGLVATAFLGYIGLAQFVATQIVVTGAVLVTMYIGFLSGQAVSRTDAFAKTLTGEYLARRHNLTAVRLDQIGLVLGLTIYFLVCLFGIPLIMLKWGFRGADIWSIFVQLFTEIQVGNISISLLGIFAGILVFAGGYYATRWFQRWLDANVMVRSQVDIGVRNSVNTVLGYAGIVVAGLIGISAAGINLSSLALVAGALSLGIGFGLQTIVQNFVSGLILLIERPFKVGDWIVNGPVEGFVRRISVRATEIETFQNQSIIVPNSQLINAAVGNWTLHNTVARSEVPVSVSYDSDPRQVMDILLDIARNHPLVLTMPEPNVGFQAFGQFSMDFELRFYLADLFQGGPVKNEIRATIIERFRKDGIVIPIPQSNIVLHSADDSRVMEEALTLEGMSPEAARRVLLRAERRQQVSRGLARDMDLVDDERGPHDGLHHAADADGDGDADDNR